MKPIPLVGGPNDGKLVDDYGPRYREPIYRRPQVVIYDASQPISPSDGEIQYREYVKERWSYDMSYRYVLVTSDLGQKSFEPREDIWS